MWRENMDPTSAGLEFVLAVSVSQSRALLESRSPTINAIVVKLRFAEWETYWRQSNEVKSRVITNGL